MNLYKKIYEAIDNGIQKALIITDNQDNDVSVNWKNKQVTADFNILNSYVRKLLNCGDSIDCKQIYDEVKQYEDIKYKPANISELNKIIGKLVAIKGVGYNTVKLGWIDVSKIAIIILNNDIEIPFNEFDKKRHIAKFIKLNCKNEVGHDIILHKDLLLANCRWIGSQLKTYEDAIWKTDNIEISELKKYEFVKSFNNPNYFDAYAYDDYNGYDLTYHNQDIQTYNRDIANYPAIMHCMQQNNNFSGYECYLPSICELDYILHNIDLINCMLQKISKNRLYFLPFWSSTEISKYYVMCFEYGTAVTHTYQSQNIRLRNGIVFKYKIDEAYVLPFFKKI